MSLSTLRKTQLPSEQLLHIIASVDPASINNIELSNKQLSDIVRWNLKSLPLQNLLKIVVGPVYEADASGDVPNITSWPSGSEWEIVYEQVTHQQLGSRNPRRFPDTVTAWTAFCGLVSRAYVSKKITFAFVHFDSALVQMFINATRTGNIATACKYAAFGVCNGHLFQKLVNCTYDNADDYEDMSQPD